MGWVAMLTDLIPLVLTALGGAGGATAIAPIVMKVLSWLANKITKGNLEIDDSVRGVIETAIKNGIGFAVAKRQEKNPSADPTAPLTTEDVAAAKQYVETQVPDKLAHFGVDARDLGDMVVSRFGKLLLDRLAAKIG